VDSPLLYFPVSSVNTSQLTKYFYKLLLLPTFKVGVLAILQESAGAEIDQFQLTGAHVDDHLE
jgi:hypothetical protein